MNPRARSIPAFAALFPLAMLGMATAPAAAAGVPASPGLSAATGDALVRAVEAAPVDVVEARQGWIAWYGCWEAADPSGGEAGDLLVCFEPLADAAGVEIRTVMGGEVLAVERMVADGTPVAIEEGGCAGERTARWSADGARVFVASTMDCGGGMTRTTAGVMAMAPNGPEWVEIHSVRASGQEPTLGVRRFAPADAGTLARHGVEAPAVDRGLAVSTARQAVARALDLDDVVEVVQEADAEVARALVAEIGRPFALDARTLRDLSRQGVPGDVIDVMVAVTYPERFEVEGVTREAARVERPSPRAADPARAPWPPRSAPVGPMRAHWDWFSWSMRYSPRTAWLPGWGSFSPYWRHQWQPSRVVIVQPSIRDRQARVHPLTGYSTDGTSVRPARQPSGLSAAAARAAAGRLGVTSGSDAASGSRSGGGSVSPTGHSASGSQGSTGRQATRRSGGGG